MPTRIPGFDPGNRTAGRCAPDRVSSGRIAAGQQVENAVGPRLPPLPARSGIELLGQASLLLAYDRGAGERADPIFAFDFEPAFDP